MLRGLLISAWAARHRKPTPRRSGHPEDTQKPVVSGGGLTGAKNSASSLRVVKNSPAGSAAVTSSATPASAADLAQGTPASNNGCGAVSSSKKFGFSATQAGTINTNYRPAAKPTDETTGRVTFSGGRIPGLLHNFDTAASLRASVGRCSRRTHGGFTTQCGRWQFLTALQPLPPSRASVVAAVWPRASALWRVFVFHGEYHGLCQRSCWSR